MNAALLALVLLAPAPKKHWSKAHFVALWAPNTWTVAEGKGHKAFEIIGPKLGRGTPHVVLHNAGLADKLTLERKTKELVDVMRNRPGWRVVAQKRKTLGPYAAYRVGFDFNQEGRKGRARFTVLLMGGSFYVLEMNASAAHFPGPTFDAIEKSLEVPWSDHKLTVGITLQVPRGWTFNKEGRGATMHGPLCGMGPPVVRLRPGRIPAEQLKDAKSGPKVAFLGGSRATQLVEREVDGLQVRMLHVHHDGLTALAIIPVAVWEDMLPTVAAILASVKRPEPRGEK